MRCTRRIAKEASVILMVAFALFGITSVYAQTQATPGAATPAPVEKSYYYPSIATAITVNPDSTLSVTETQTFAFTGNFHAADRNISLRKVSGITDISVTDITTGVPLTEVASPISDITAPSAAGKFAVWKDGRADTEDIEWYFNLQNATHTWMISYKVHGAIEFDRQYDRLYWNIFSDYSVPVEQATVSVVLPQAVPSSSISETSYRTFASTAEDVAPSYASGTFSFAAAALSPNEAYTIDVTWPKGLVSEQAFWWDLLSLYVPVLATVGIVLLCLLVTFLWWLRIKLYERKGNIIPQYEPPEGLRPAIAEAVATEKITSKGFAATIVDLAVRGVVRIDEDDSRSFSPRSIINIVFASFLTVFVIAYGGSFVAMDMASGGMGIVFLITAVFFAFIILKIVLLFRDGFKKSDYRITALKDYAGDPALKEYEKHYLSLIFSVGSGGTSVSTKDFKKLMGGGAQQFHKQIVALRKEIGAEANSETSAFSEFHVSGGVNVWYILFVFFIFFAPVLISVATTWVMTLVVSLAAIAATVTTIVRMARRTARGKILRDEWLGFKLYLEVAEKYQLQNLTPDLFEKYLPYAMIFGIEKKWAQVFERANITLAAPQWYGHPGGMTAGAVMGANAGSAAFSASAFSSGFSASFSSAIASSIGGGASGGAGGGGAGGGGGGGGGGAR